MGAAGRACERRAAAAAARRVQHERKRHRRPVDRHGDRSAEHPLRRRDGDQQGGQRVHRSAGAVGSRRRGRLRHRRACDHVHRRPRAHQAGAVADGRPEAGRPHRRRRPQHRAGRSAGDRTGRPRDARVGAEPRVPERGELARRPGDVPRAGRDRGALAGVRRQPRRRSDDSDAARSVRRPADDRRAENADSDLRRVRAVNDER